MKEKAVAKRTEERLVDDFDASEAVERVPFMGLDGVMYYIDLSPEHYKDYCEFMQRHMDHAWKFVVSRGRPATVDTAQFHATHDVQEIQYRPTPEAKPELAKAAPHPVKMTSPGKGVDKEQRRAVCRWWGENWVGAGLKEPSDAQRRGAAGAIPKLVWDAFQQYDGKRVPVVSAVPQPEEMKTTTGEALATATADKAAKVPGVAFQPADTPTAGGRVNGAKKATKAAKRTRGSRLDLAKV